MDAQQVIAQAEKEVAEEQFKKAVELEKIKIRYKYDKRAKWYIRLFPWRIRIVRVDEMSDKDWYAQQLRHSNSRLHELYQMNQILQQEINNFKFHRGDYYDRR